MDDIALMREIARLQNQIDALRTIEVGGVWKNWTPTVTAAGSMTISNLVVDVARYTTIGDSLAFEVAIKFDTGGTASVEVYITYPFSVITSSYRTFEAMETNSSLSAGVVYAPTATHFGVRRSGGSNWTLAANLRISANGIIKYK